MLLDGGTGSELIKLGMPGGVSSEKWISENPTSIITVQGNYINAGSDAVLAPTFHCNRHCLADYGIAEESDTLNTELVTLSKKACEGTMTLVFGDLSPAALLLKPLGDYDFEYIYDVYAQQVRALESVGVDAYFVETVMNIAEMRALALAVKDNSQKPLLTTMTVTVSGKTQMSGTDALAGLITMQSMGVDAFGLNCSVGPEEILGQMQRLAPYADVPLIAKPNAGMPKVVDGKAFTTAHRKNLQSPPVPLLNVVCAFSVAAAEQTRRISPHLERHWTKLTLMPCRRSRRNIRQLCCQQKRQPYFMMPCRRLKKSPAPRTWPTMPRTLAVLLRLE